MPSLSTRSSRAPLALLAATMALASGGACRKGSGDSKPTPTPRRERAVALGKKATRTLAASLGARVKQAMQKGGPASAIEVCAGEAESITAQVASTLPAGVRLKRTSDRVRNPRNAPDAAERSVLDRFAQTLERGERLPEYHLEETTGSKGKAYRYFQPIRIAGRCLVCHGPRDKLSPAVAEALKKRYPGDAAVGYRAKELRGVFSVTIPETALP